MHCVCVCVCKDVNICVCVCVYVYVCIGYMESIAVGMVYASKKGYKLDPDQESIALGLANIVGSFFSAFPTTGGFSRTAVSANAGLRHALVGGFNVLHACLRSTHACTHAHMRARAVRVCVCVCAHTHTHAHNHTHIHTYTHTHTLHIHTLAYHIHIHIQGVRHNWLASSRVSSCLSSSLP